MQDKDQNKECEKYRKNFSGKVVSTKMEKTITVLIERQIQDKKYKKIVKRRKKLLAHVPDGLVCAEGDFVTIESCRPISKNKSFILKSINK